MAYLTQASPRKVVPLSGGPTDLQRTRSEQAAPAPTRKAYYCGVVVEGGLDGHPIAQDVEQLVASLGEIVTSGNEKIGMERSSSAPNISDAAGPSDPSNGRKRALTTTSAFNDVLNELVVTERSYVSRLRILKLSYADPLRKFARRKEEAILPAYEAKILFGNIDAILPANEAFLADLERMMAPDGPSTVGGIGDVALKHIRDMRAFDCYKQYYSKREEAQSIFERELMKRSTTGFAGFIERTKYSTDAKNRVGLRELLMEPIQRIPRYTLLFRTMIKYMAPNDPQRAKLLLADEAASKVALAETDDHTKRAAVMYCLERSIEGFPANLISNSRTFIDCIDIEDLPVDTAGPSVTENGVATGPIHCTLFLFDDRLLIVKRPNGGAGGRSLSGLDETEKAMRIGGLPVGIKKGVMSCKGVLDVTDVVATDVGGSDFHLYLEMAPADQYSDRWANRPFRSCTVVHPPSPANLDPVRTRNDKLRFLENLWNAQAFYRTKDERSIARLSEEREMTGKSLVRTWFNIYQRMDWLKEPKKNKIVLHIDPMGSADPLPFGLNGPPYVIARAQPMAGELCRYTVTSSDPNDEGEEDIVHTGAVAARIVQTIHQFGLFKFRTGKNSLPSTPSSARSRSGIFGLDAISRNLFNASASIRSADVFGSMTSSRRSKPPITRSSTVTTGSSDSSLKFSQRSNSTAGTSVVSLNAEEEPSKQRLAPPPRKLVKRGRSRSPGGTSGPESGSEVEYDRRQSGGSTERSSQRRRKSGKVENTELAYYDDDEEMEDVGERNQVPMDESEWDLSMRLELARKNSQSQEARVIPRKAAPPVESAIQEDVTMEESISAAFSTQAASGSNHLSVSENNSPPQSSLYYTESVTPTQSLAESIARPRSALSGHSDRRPMGPRSPTPPARPVTPTSIYRPTTPTATHATYGSLGQGNRPPSRPTTPTYRHAAATMSSNHPLPPVPPLPPLANIGPNPTIDDLERAVSPVKSKRMLFEAGASSSRGLPEPPRTSFRPVSSSANRTASPDLPATVEPLSIKKKTSVRRTSPPSRKSLGSALERNSTTRRISTQVHLEREETAAAVTQSLIEEEEEEEVPSPRSVPAKRNAPSDEPAGSTQGLINLAQVTREDADSCRRTVKRIKLEVQSLQQAPRQTPSTRDPLARVRSPPAGIPRSPQSRRIADTAAQARMEEVRRVIQYRNGIAPSIASVADPAPSNDSERDAEESARHIDNLIAEADRHLEDIISHEGQLEVGLSQLTSDYQKEVERATRAENEVGRAKRQCELVKKLLADATAENEIMYDAFNEELDGMFNDAQLPETEAWDAMTSDLRRTKESRNALSRENTTLKRQLQEVELQNKEWETLLRNHGLIS